MEPSVSHPHLGHPAILIASSSAQKSLDDFDVLAKDPLHSIITGAREAYLIKYLAHKLGHNITKSDDVRNLSELIGKSAKEIERLWRTAACMADAPVSTSYPFLPVMPMKAHFGPSSRMNTENDAMKTISETSGQGATLSEPQPALDGSQRGPSRSEDGAPTKSAFIEFTGSLFPLIRHRCTLDNDFI